MKAPARILSAVMSIILVVGLMPIPAFAASPTMKAAEMASPSQLLLQATTEMPEWTSSLFAQKASTYDNRLALKAAEMCENSYPHDSQAIMRMFGYYGMDDAKSYNYKTNFTYDGKALLPSGSDNSAFVVGHDVMKMGGTDYTVLVVVARGTQSTPEKVGDWLKLPKVDFLGEKVWNNINDFYNEIDKGVADYVNRHEPIKVAASAKKLKILVTGHSLGGAAANMYAAKLTKQPPTWANKLSKNDIYAYTFGAIKVLTEGARNVAYGFENIHNVYNDYDSFGPLGAKGSLGVSTWKAKFGHTDTFNIGEKEENDLLSTPNHDVSTYIEAMKANKVSCEGESYRVNFDNGLSGSSHKVVGQSIFWEKSTALKANSFTRSGYKFAGWNTKANGKGKAYKNKAQVKNLAKPEDTITLYAQWTKLPSFKVVFKANKGYGAMLPQTIVRGKSTALKANTFFRTGYTFNGWNTKANGKGKSYKNKQKVKNLAATNKSITLYAQWKKSSSKFKYKRNSNGTLTITGYKGSKKVKTLNIPAKIDGMKVSTIGKNAFKGLESLTKVTIANGITSIKDYAFSSSWNLATIKLPSTLKEVGALNFVCPSKKGSLKLPGSLTKVGSLAFAFTYDVTIGKDLKTFSWMWFRAQDGASCLSKVHIESGSKYLSVVNGSVYNKAVTRLITGLPQKDKSGSYTEELVLPNTVTTIGKNAFGLLNTPYSIKLSPNTTTLEDMALMYFNGTDTLTLPSKVSKLGEKCFLYSSFKTLVIESKNLTAVNVKNCLVDSYIDTIIVHVSDDDDENEEYAEKYESVFSYSNVGRYVDVEAW